MLGLADRARVDRPVRSADEGRRRRGARTNCATQYDIGADPAVVLADLAEFTHFVTRVKVVPAVADDVSLAEAERTRGRAFAAKLSMRVLSRTWQMLLKGIAEVQEAGRPLAAAEMVLVRIAYAADLPTPDEVIRALGDGGARRGAGAGNGGGVASGRAGAVRRRATRRRAAPRALARAARCRRGRCRSRRRARRSGRAGARARAASRSWSRWRSEKRDIADEDRAGARRAAGALRGRPARDRARAERAARRWSTICRASCRPGPAGAGWSWSRTRPARRRCARRPRRARPSSSAACAPTRWCRRCSTRFPGAEIVGVQRPERAKPPPTRADDAAARADDSSDDEDVSAWPISSA